MDAMIFEIRRFTLHDGPGLRTTVFFKGCPLSCWWCHNPESQLFSQEQGIRKELLDGQEFERKEMIGTRIGTQELLENLLKDRIFWDESGGGVTLSGGEPLAQPAFLNEFIPLLKEQGVHVTLDTSGYATPEVIAETATKADLVLYDLKLVNPTEHKKYTGVGNQEILTNLKMLDDLDIRLSLRHPVIPGINDTEEEITGLLQYLQLSRLKCRSIHLLPYHSLARNKYFRTGRNYKLDEAKSLASDALISMKEQIEALGWRVTIGG